MRPTHLSLPVLFVLLAPGVAHARARTSALTAAGAAAAQALPPAEVPEPEVVETALSVSAPPPRATAIDDTWAEVPDEPPIAEEIDRDSADIEAVRRAEQEAHVRDGAREAKDGKAESESGKIELIPELDRDLAALRAEYDIPIDVNEAVADYIRFFQSPVARPHFVKWLGRSHRYLDRYRAILREEGLPEDTVYLAMIESGFGNFAYSRAKASGPWQFIPATGKQFGLRQDFWVDERRDPERSARAAARYLKRLYEQTGDWRLAWAGYNAGGGRIQKALDAGYRDFWEMAAAPGKVLHPETKGYVPKLMAAAILSKHPQAFGFTDEEIEKQSWTEYEEVTIPSATLLAVVAKAAGVAERELIDLNPELRRSCTPPRAYKVKIPRRSAETFASSWPAMQPRVRLTFAGHVVRRGETLSSIARRYGVPVQGIAEMNGLKSGRKLRKGQELMIPRPVGTVALASAREPQLERAAAAPRARARTAVRVPAEHGRTTHRVRAGDTLWSISQRFGVDMTDLCRWNNIKNPKGHKLLVGAKLVVFSERG